MAENHNYTYVSPRAGLDWANHCFVTGARTAIADFLEDAHARGVDLGNPTQLLVLVSDLRAQKCETHR